MVKNLPSNAGDAGSILGRGTKIPHVMGQLSPCTTTTEPEQESLCAANYRAHALWSPRATTREEKTVHCELVSLGHRKPRFGELGKNFFAIEKSDIYHFSVKSFSFHDYIQDVMIYNKDQIFILFEITK